MLLVHPWVLSLTRNIIIRCKCSAVLFRDSFIYSSILVLLVVFSLPPFGVDFAFGIAFPGLS